ncbi:hypothetical protein [Streptomyces tubercidicus]|uniref:hypothetical protein n=1 Tax=Streptomyces tubercidicus TaxID=47759 RepID=UPI003F5BB7FF
MGWRIENRKRRVSLDQAISFAELVSISLVDAYLAEHPDLREEADVLVSNAIAEDLMASMQPAGSCGPASLARTPRQSATVHGDASQDRDPSAKIV